MSRRKQPNPNKVNPVMENSEEPRDLSPDLNPDQSPDLKPQETHNEIMNGLSNPEEKLTNGESEEPMETEPEPETRPETRPETGDLSSINEMMSAVMSSGVMSSSTINGEGEEPCESAASANSAGPSPSPSPTKTLTSAMRAPPSRNQRRTQDSKDDSAFVCPLCDKNCQTQHQLTMHIRQHNADTGASDHSCSICGKCLSSASSLDRHMLVHSGERPYKCSVCGQTFTTNGNMHRHMKIHEKDPASGLVLLSPPSPSPSKRRRPSVKRRGGEEGEEPPSKKTVEEASVEDSVTPTKTVEEELPCPICFKVLTSRLELDAHMDTHPDTALRCDMCCLTFRTHRGLLRHNAAVHKLLPLDPSGRPFIQNNPSIPAGFNELAFIDFSCAKFSLIAQVWCETNLRRCISKFHRFVCESCDRAFPLSSALDLHDCSADKPSIQSVAEELKASSKNHQENQDQTVDEDQDQTRDQEQSKEPDQTRDQEQTQEQDQTTDQEQTQEQEGFLEALGLKLTSKIPVGPSEAELVQARLDSIKTIPVDPSSVHTEALSLGLALGVPLFQTGFLLQSEGGAMGSEAPPLMDLAGLQHILQVAAATPNQIALSLKGGATGVSSQKPPLKPRPPPAPRCGLASTPPPPQPASLGCISPSLPPPAPLFKCLSAQTDPPSPSLSPSLSPSSPSHSTSLSPDDSVSRKAPPTGVLSCRYCAQTFQFSAQLQAHLRQHLGALQLGVLPHQCNICEYVAPDKATLIRHLRTHSGERPYVCRVCHYPFTVKANCERHLRKKHNKTSRKDIEKNIKYVTSTATNNITAALTAAAATVAKAQAEEAETLCRFCGEDLKSYRALQIHLRTHNGCQRKPFECRRCGAAFLAKRNCIHHLLKQHPEVQEREIEEHIQTLPPAKLGANAAVANVTANANIANQSRAVNGLPSVKLETVYPSDSDQPLDFSAKASRGATCGVKLELVEGGGASDEPIDLSVPSKRQRRDPDVKQEKTADASRDDKMAANVLACFLSSSGPAPSGSAPSPAGPTPSCLRAARLKPLLPKPSSASSELPPLASIAQIISSVSTAADLLRRETVTAATVAPGGVAKAGSAEVRAEPEREATQEDEDPARKRPRKKPAPKGPALDLESSGEFASVEKMLATTDANKFSPYLQNAQSTQSTQSTQGTQQGAQQGAQSGGKREDAVSEPKEEPKAPKGKKNAYSNSAQKMTCPFCPRVFPWASSLQRHMLTHTGQKPFPCPKCDAFFSTKSNCERHLLRKHGVTNRTLRRNGTLVKKEEEGSHESAESQSEAEPVLPESDPKPSETNPTPNTPPVQSEPQGEEPAVVNPAHNPKQDGASPEQISANQSELSAQPQEALESSSTERQNSSAKSESADDDDNHSNKSLDLNFGRKLIDFKLSAAPSGPSQDEQQPPANSPNNANGANPDSSKEFKHVCRVCHKSFRYSATLTRHEKAHANEETVSATEERERESEKTEERTEEEEEEREEEEKMSDSASEEQEERGESELESADSESEEREREEGRSDDESGSEGRGQASDEGRGQARGEGRSQGGANSRVDKRKKICNVCGKKFWSLQDLTRHMRSHTGERPYQCSTCERTFTLKHSLVRHQRIHLKPRTNDEMEHSEEHGEEPGTNQEPNLENHEEPNEEPRSAEETSEEGDSGAPRATCTLTENEGEAKEEAEEQTTDREQDSEKSAPEMMETTSENVAKTLENSEKSLEKEPEIPNTKVGSAEDAAEKPEETCSESTSAEAPESAPETGGGAAHGPQAESSKAGHAQPQETLPLEPSGGRQ